MKQPSEHLFPAGAFEILKALAGGGVLVINHPLQGGGFRWVKQPEGSTLPVAASRDDIDLLVLRGYIRRVPPLGMTMKQGEFSLWPYPPIGQILLAPPKQAKPKDRQARRQLQRAQRKKKGPGEFVDVSYRT